MKYELLDKIVPDHELIIQNRNVVYADDKFIKILQKHPEEIIYDLDINTFFEQFEDDMTHRNFNEQFMNDLASVIKAGQRAIMLINSVIKEKQSEALYLFLINVQKIGGQIKLKLYNIVTLTKVFKGLFSKDLWQNLRGTFVKKSSALIKKQLYCAHEVLLSIYNLSNYSLFTLDNTKKCRTYDLGELLFYFNPMNNKRKLLNNSGLSTLKMGLSRSMNRLSMNFIEDLDKYDCMISNSLEANLLVRIES